MYTIFTHVNLPNAVVVEYQDELFLVLNIRGGWKQRQSYHGYVESLRTLDHEEGRQIAARIGLGHGGYREGAGRTVMIGGAMQKKTVTLSPSDITYLSALGNGNLSAGIREAVKHLQDDHD
jgi:hypothetical protein